MNNQTKIRVIRAICWMGVVADALWVVALVWPPLYTTLIGRDTLQPDLFMRLNMGIGASLMAGWMLLLAWTAGKPIERRAVMLLSVLPVIAGLSVVTIIGLVEGNAGNIWILGKCIFLGVAMLSAYMLANTIAKETANEVNH
ncbi:hypothetical protein [Desulfosarcina sp.]|uniref:hypothetical protein n=1 Tax=Desulfosarcina sp. TaxID=2027861 RepID=UPI0029B3098B|nr:hypothetical protein [Desulfosarcina sp.]MDX2455494.1 hypothetical protein [Desulfosarcina sp.]